MSVQVVRRQGDDVLIRSRELAGRDIVAERSPLIGTGIKVRPLRPGAAETEPQAPAMVELTEERRAKLDALRAAGVDPFPRSFPGRQPIAEARAHALAFTWEASASRHAELIRSLA